MPNCDEMQVAAEWIEQFEAFGGAVMSDGQTVTFVRKFIGFSLADQGESLEMLNEITADRQRTVH
jgi:hypothetical protein